MANLEPNLSPALDEINTIVPEDVMSKGKGFNEYLFTTLIRSRLKIERLMLLDTPESYLSIYNAVKDVHFAVAIKCRDKKYMEGFYPERKKQLINMFVLLKYNQDNRTRFYLYCDDWLDKLAEQIRRLDFAPPAQTPVLAGFGEVDEDGIKRRGLAKNQT
jgi:hypothetical protein